MSTPPKRLSTFDKNQLPDGSGLKIGIVVADWNREITDKLLQGATKTLQALGVSESDIQVQTVPGSFELTFAAKLMAEAEDMDAVISLGCVIKGETPHFDYICQSVTYGLTELNLSYDIPFIFGVLTTLSQQQALDRAGGKYGNKGDEAAVAAIRMARIK